MALHVIRATKARLSGKTLIRIRRMASRQEISVAITSSFAIICRIVMMKSIELPKIWYAACSISFSFCSGREGRSNDLAGLLITGEVTQQAGGFCFSHLSSSTPHWSRNCCFPPWLVRGSCQTMESFFPSRHPADDTTNRAGVLRRPGTGLSFPQRKSPCACR